MGMATTMALSPLRPIDCYPSGIRSIRRRMDFAGAVPVQSGRHGS